MKYYVNENREIFSLEELVKEFDYHHMSKSPAVFDMTDDGVAKAVDEEVKIEDAADAENVMNNCPVGAIGQR